MTVTEAQAFISALPSAAGVTFEVQEAVIKRRGNIVVIARGPTDQAGVAICTHDTEEALRNAAESLPQYLKP